MWEGGREGVGFTYLSGGDLGHWECELVDREGEEIGRN